MKNLTIKKVALGLFLAGYAASGAFALDAKTDAVIQGTKPALRSIGSQNDHTLTVTISTDDQGNTSISNRAAQKGDYVVIKYDLFDADGDEDNGKIKDTLLVSVRKNGAWSSISSLTDLTTGKNGNRGYVSFKIDDNFVGADKIGFRILERTDFGLPYANLWLGVNDIWASTTPTQTRPTDPDNPTTTPPVDGSNPGNPTPGDNSDRGPGDAAPGYGPITSATAKVGIFKVVNGVADETVNYDHNSSVEVKYGDTFQAIVWDDINSNDNIDTGEAKLTGYNFAWTLFGTYGGVTASTSDNLGTTDTITLAATNGDGMYNRTDNGDAYKAGGQGFQLKVTATN